MKAAVYYECAPDVFKYEEVPDPPLRPRGVRIDVRRSPLKAATC
jgi:NADPH:quinone reductase-like Zn-dependent oxidoreductase